MAFQLTETNGFIGASIKAIELAFESGQTATFGPTAAESTRVGPGATVQVPVITIKAAGSFAPSVQIRVMMTDDAGASSIAGAAASVFPTHRVGGRVTDGGTNRALPGARVTVTFGRALGRTAMSDAAGNWLLLNIPVGPAVFDIDAPGYSTVTRTTTISANTTIDAALSKR